MRSAKKISMNLGLIYKIVSFFILNLKLIYLNLIELVQHQAISFSGFLVVCVN